MIFLIIVIIGFALWAIMCYIYEVDDKFLVIYPILCLTVIAIVFANISEDEGEKNRALMLGCPEYELVEEPLWRKL